MRELSLLIICFLCILNACISWKPFSVKLQSKIQIKPCGHAVKPSSFKTFPLSMSSNEGSDVAEKSFNPITILDPGTRGGLVFWGVALTLGPLGFYTWYTSINPDSVKAGAYVGSILVFLISVMWTFSYVFRVANKDTTYAKQLRDYENAVLQKRLGELSDEEITTIIEEIESKKTKQKK